MVKKIEQQRDDLIGVDVGGTFTDIIRFNQKTGKILLAKVSSTTKNQASGVMNAISAVKSQLSNVAMIIHGTTTTTNACM